MTRWRDIQGGAWSSSGEILTGYGPGVGEFHSSYAINDEHGEFLNGTISANLQIGEWQAGDLNLRPSQLASAGLLCRADEFWTFLSMYVIPHPNDANAHALTLGVFKGGLFSPIVSLNEKVLLGDAFNSFSLVFISGNVTARIVTGSATHELNYVCPHVPFPGYVGVLKFRDTYVVGTDFAVTPAIGTPGLASSDVIGAREPVYDVFVCHCSDDKDKVLEVLADFRNEGITYWVDHEQIEFGDSIIEQIEEGLQQCRHLLVLLSGNLRRSSWCRAEYGPVLHREFSVNADCKVIPLRLDECADEDIPVLLCDKKMVDYADKSEFQKLLRFLLAR